MIMNKVIRLNKLSKPFFACAVRVIVWSGDVMLGM